MRIAALALAVFALAAFPAAAGDELMGLGGLFATDLQLPRKGQQDLQFTRADRWRMVGKTLFVSGNVYIPYGNVVVRADRAMIDLESKDVEAAGHLEMILIKKTQQTLSMEDYEHLQLNPTFYSEIVSCETDPFGQMKVTVDTYSFSAQAHAERLAGNFESGVIELYGLRGRLNGFAFRAAKGQLEPDGVLNVKDAEVSVCSFLEDDQAHFSFSMGTAKMYPHETEGYGFGKMRADTGEYSMWGYNTLLRIYGVPVLWLPMIYKPKDENPGLCSVMFGKQSKLGYFVSLSKRFDLTDNPYSFAAVDFAWLSERGFLYGGTFKVGSDTSQTRIDAFAINDRNPYGGSTAYKNAWRAGTNRFHIPDQRFDLTITHLTHITPRLDFRAQAVWLSDIRVLEDYQPGYAQSYSQPATYASLEYQFDRFSAALYARVRINDFYSTVEKLPEFRLDVPRQEIIPGWNLYYQGSHSAAYLRQRFPNFDRDPINPLSKLNDYQTGRFDSVNFLYFPIRLDWLNIVPRAGIRLTGYTNSSKEPVTPEELYIMQLQSKWTVDSGMPVHNYDNDGGGRFRVVGELGVEANTKIYRSWQDVKSTFWQLDGLRHVAEPYVNYTFIPKPTVSRDYLYYFDDIDRIDEQNFVRFGLRNRLQTRSGGFTNGSIREWFSMENYWDLFLNKDDTYGYNQIGDFCTKLTFSPTSRLSFTGFFSIDAGHNQAHDTEAMRNGRSAGRPGISGSIFNRLNFTISYSLLEDVVLNFSYNYRDAYAVRSAYSMGSTMTEIESGSIFEQIYYTGRTQTLNFGIRAPLTPDRKTMGAYTLSYDFEKGGITGQTLSVSRIFHCVKASLVFNVEREDDTSDGSHNYDLNCAFTISLVGLEGPLQAAQRSAVNAFTNIDK